MTATIADTLRRDRERELVTAEAEAWTRYERARGTTSEAEAWDVLLALHARRVRVHEGLGFVRRHEVVAGRR